MVRTPWMESLGLAAMSYVVIDYLRHISPAWHARHQPELWSVLALVSVTRVLAYQHWSSELRSVLPFIASLLFMVAAFLVEMLSVRFSTAILGLDWHGYGSKKNVGEYRGEYRPEWGSMSFLVDILRPTASEGSSWFSLLKKAGGSCNDLLYSGHMVVAVPSLLTAMAWTCLLPRKFRVHEAYGGWSSAFIWLLVLHSGQREIRGKHHYIVDCVVAIYVGILLWRISRFLRSTKDSSRVKRLTKFEQIHGRLIKAAKDSHLDKVREILGELELTGQAQHQKANQWAMKGFAGVTIVSSLIICLLAFTWTSEG